MLDWKQIGGEDLDLLERYRAYNEGISDYTPTSLLCYAEGMEIRYARSNGALLLKYRQFDGNEYALMPLGAGESDLRRLRDDFAERGRPLRFDLLSRGAAEQITDVLGMRLVRLRECFDYLYTTDNFITMQGSEHATNRNKLSRLLRNHDVVYRSYEPADRDLVLDFCRVWVRDYVKDVPKYFFFANAELRGLETVTRWYDQMPTTRGGVLLIDGAPAGFGFGDTLSRGTCTLHNLKIRRDLPGVQLVFIQRFLETEFADKKYMNFEDDMGQPGLRTAKQRLRPCALLDKYGTGDYEACPPG